MADTGLDGALYELMRHNAKVARGKGDIETAQYWNRFIAARAIGRPYREALYGRYISTGQNHMSIPRRVAEQAEE